LRSQAAKGASPRYWRARSKAFSIASCSTSCATSGRPVRRNASVHAARSNCRYTVSNAVRSPRFRRATVSGSTCCWKLDCASTPQGCTRTPKGRSLLLPLPSGEGGAKRRVRVRDMSNPLCGPEPSPAPAGHPLPRGEGKPCRSPRERSCPHSLFPLLSGYPLCPRTVRGHFFRPRGFCNTLNRHGNCRGTGWHRTCSIEGEAASAKRCGEDWTGMNIRDTSAQDRIIEKRVNKKKLAIFAGLGVAVLILLVWLVPGALRLFSAGSSVSASRLQIATVERGSFVRDIAADGRVVAAVSPTLYANANGAVTLQVHAGDQVKKGQVLAVIASPELTNKLAQEESNADAMQVAYQQAKIDANQQRAKLQEAFENAKIDEQSAKRDLARYQTAFDKGAVSKLEVDRHNDALEKARIQ